MNNADLYGNRNYWLKYARTSFWMLGGLGNHNINYDTQIWIAIFRAYLPKEMQ